MRWLTFLATLCLRAQSADLLVTNATIYTTDPAHPTASAIAIKSGRIIYVGDRFQGGAGKTIDARGATVVPGLIDSHVHMEALGDSLETLDLRGVKSEADAAEFVRKAAQNRKPGEWIRGRAWDQNLWPGKQFPTKESISKAAPNNPVALSRVDGHATWANQQALDLADINASTADPAGGKIIRNQVGQPAGVLVDRAQGLVTRKVPPATPEETRRRILHAARECARLGITSVHDAGVTAGDLAAYRALISTSQLPVRVNAMIGGVGPLWEDYKKRGPEIGEFLTVRSIKMYADGALGSRGAALLAPYSDDAKNTGLLINDEALLRQVSLDAVRTGFQVCTHAIGDRANHIALNAYAAALKGPNDKRFRIEHAQVVAPEDFARFKQYSVIASMQPTHATSDMGWAAARLGPDRVKGAYAWQAFLKLGVPLASGSDFPVENPNPIWGFYSAVTREDQQGNPEGGWFPDQRLSREQALYSWTQAGAYADFEEETKGSLTPGKAADFVMLSADIMKIPATGICRARVTMTVVGGRVVYSE
ncbi:MAG: Amidohydrolase 3 [Bryobacterales bacterium]|nr:Amidohydrolase 3 [Bryobacterales bacterium]